MQSFTKNTDMKTIAIKQTVPKMKETTRDSWGSLRSYTFNRPIALDFGRPKARVKGA